MKNLIRNKHFYIMICVDAMLVIAAHILSYFLRFEGSIPAAEIKNIGRVLPALVPLKLVVFFFFKLYRGMWRYTSLSDLRNVLFASTLSTILIVAAVLFKYHFMGFSRSVFIIDWGLTVFFIGGMRVSVRMMLTNNISSFWSGLYRREVDRKARKLLIIGAGDAGEKVLREIKENPSVRLEPIGFIDDAKEKQGKSIHGIPVLGTVDQIEDIPVEYDEILIAIPSAKGQQMRRIVDACENTGKRFRTVPSLGELFEGKISVNSIREVSLEDLIGREEVRLDQEKISQFLSQKRILVTGAGGSIGSELVRQIGRFNPQSISLMDFSEYNLFQIAMECRHRFPRIKIVTTLADVRNRESVRRTLHGFLPQVVFHTAAYKHVPIQEKHPQEAVFANIMGTRNVVEAAVEFGVDRFVLVSTDKAVRPSNVMGATKRLAEILIACMNGKTNTLFMAVRFGNVIRSSGSVIPLFQEQIARGGPVTVTHPEVMRYFMSIPEAAQLILQAGAMGKGGEIFILEMGKPIKILDMARDLIRLHGLEPERDIPIQFIGLRPGEKLYEELITEGEGITSTSHEKIMVLKGNVCEAGPLLSGIEELLRIASRGSERDIKTKLKELVPEYEPAPNEATSP